MNRKKKRNIVIGVLCGVLLLMVVGYAAFSTVLNINGTTSITSNWKVLITNIISKDIVGSAYDIEDPTHTELEATFKTGLISPGDSITYDITVENQGDLDAYLQTITINKKDNPAILFEVSGLQEGDMILPESSKILTITVTYNPELTDDPEERNEIFDIELSFSQELEAKPIITYKCPEEYESEEEVGPDTLCTKTTVKSASSSVSCSCPYGYTKSGSGCNITCSKSTTISATANCSNLCGDYCYSSCGVGTPNYGQCMASGGYIACGRCCGGGSWKATYTCPSGYTSSGSGSSMKCTTTTNTSKIQTTNYNCDSGYTKSGSGSSTKCTKIETAPSEQVTTYTCPDGYQLEDKKCYKE